MEASRAHDTDFLEAGAQVGRYELIRRLEVGGMAEIYLARTTAIEGFEKQVVVKRILPQLAANPEFVAMFLDEARIAATLHHPNIAQVYDAGNDPSGYYIAMEYVDGKDLRHLQWILQEDERDLPLEHAVAIVLGAAAGLHSAHEARRPDGRPLDIVHRDVSPANIIVTWEGCIKIIDFGIAKAAYRATRTHAGVLKGKTAYMSPEQCLGERIDRRSDVFSLGIMLYELTTQQPLFAGDSAYDTMTRIVNATFPRPTEVVDTYPEALEAIVLRALQKRPGDRYQSAQEMFVDLERFARTERLPVSQFALGGYLQSLFPDEGPRAVAERAPTVAFDRRDAPRAVTDTGSAEWFEEEVTMNFDSRTSLRVVNGVDTGEHRPPTHLPDSHRPTADLRAASAPADHAEPAPAPLVLARARRSSSLPEVSVLPAGHQLGGKALASRRSDAGRSRRRPVALLSAAAMIAMAAGLYTARDHLGLAGGDEPTAITRPSPAAVDAERDAPVVDEAPDRSAVVAPLVPRPTPDTGEDERVAERDAADRTDEGESAGRRLPEEPRRAARDARPPGRTPRSDEPAGRPAAPVNETPPGPAAAPQAARDRADAGDDDAARERSRSAESTTASSETDEPGPAGDEDAARQRPGSGVAPPEPGGRALDVLPSIGGDTADPD